jgi:hypothetical protein
LAFVIHRAPSVRNGLFQREPRQPSANSDLQRKHGHRWLTEFAAGMARDLAAGLEIE